MAYEKKVEPLSKWEGFLSGFYLEIWALFFCALPWAEWSVSCEEIVFEAGITSEEDLTTVHNCIAEHRTELLTGATLLLLGFQHSGGYHWCVFFPYLAPDVYV